MYEALRICLCYMAGGRLVYYDFSMMDEITGNLREGLVDLILGAHFTCFTGALLVQKYKY